MKNIILRRLDEDGERQKSKAINVNRHGEVLAEERFEFSDILESKNTKTN